MRISDWSSDVCSSDLAGHGGAVAFDVDLGAQEHQFLHVHEAVLEDRLVDDADAFGDAVHGHELRLNVGDRKSVVSGKSVSVSVDEGGIRIINNNKETGFTKQRRISQERNIKAR